MTATSDGKDGNFCAKFTAQTFSICAKLLSWFQMQICELAIKSSTALRASARAPSLYRGDIMSMNCGCEHNRLTSFVIRSLRPLSRSTDLHCRMNSQTQRETTNTPTTWFPATPVCVTLIRCYRFDPRCELTGVMNWAPCYFGSPLAPVCLAPMGGWRRFMALAGCCKDINVAELGCGRMHATSNVSQ